MFRTMGNSQPADENVFDPATLALMSRVLDAAWTSAQEFHGAATSDRTAIRACMAEAIIEAIEAGVDDEEGLLRAAFAYRQDNTD